MLSEHGPMDASTLAEQAALLFPSLTRIANSMREKGLVTQTRDENDRRRQLIDITAKGKNIIDAHRLEATSIVENLKAQLGSENYEKLLDLLELLNPSKTPKA